MKLGIKSLSSKVSLLMAGFVTIFVVAVVIISSMTVGNVLSRDVENELQNKSLLLDRELENLKKEALNAAEWFETSEEVAAALQSNDRQEAIRLGQAALKSFGLDYFVVTDNEGKVFIRAHAPDEYGDSITDQLNIQKALNSERSVGIEQGSLVKYSIRAGTPLKDKDGRTVGAVSLGYVLSNNEFVDEHKLIYNCETTVFFGNERVATTITDESGLRWKMKPSRTRC